jgi:hypothetical protein
VTRVPTGISESCLRAAADTGVRALESVVELPVAFATISAAIKTRTAADAPSAVR